MEIFDAINRISEKSYNSYLKEAKINGEKIIGYFCSYIPEELIHAAGFIPYRMRAVENRGTSLGDTYCSSKNCSYVRHCFDKALHGDFEFLDGVLFMNGCDHNRRLYDNWRHAGIKPDFLYMLPVPHVIADPSLKQYINELNKLKTALENHYGVTISDEALKDSIKKYNRKRDLLNRIYQSRKNDPVPIKGSELLSVTLAATALPVDVANAYIEKVLQGIQGRTVSRPDDLRIFLGANCIEEVDHLKLIEDAGAVIVADKFCLGSPYMDSNIEEEGDPISAIAKRYLTHLSCPRMMDDFRRRLQYLTDTVTEYAVDAVIVEKLEFCTLFSGESVLYRKEAKKSGFPILALDRELYGGGTGQIKTRIQAFFEKVRNKQ